MVEFSYRNIWIIFIQQWTQFVQSYNRFNQYRCMGFFKKGKSMKYKNKDGIELSYTGNDYSQKLTREVIEEAIKIFEGYNRFDGRSAEWALSRGILFLKENFDIEERSDEWKISQFNRNRDKEDQVDTIEEMEKKVEELFGSKLANQ